MEGVRFGVDRNIRRVIFNNETVSSIKYFFTNRRPQKKYNAYVDYIF